MRRRRSAARHSYSLVRPSPLSGRPSLQGHEMSAASTSPAAHNRQEGWRAPPRGGQGRQCCLPWQARRVMRSAQSAPSAPRPRCPAALAAGARNARCERRSVRRAVRNGRKQRGLCPRRRSQAGRLDREDCARRLGDCDRLGSYEPIGRSQRHRIERWARERVEDDRRHGSASLQKVQKK